MADDDGYGRPVRQQVDVKFLADDKYEKNQARLTEGYGESISLSSRQDLYYCSMDS